VTINEIKEEDKDYYYMPKNVMMQYSMNVIVNRKGVRLELTDDQINEMILYGFGSMAEYIDRRKALLYEKNKARLSGLTGLSGLDILDDTIELDEDA
jgi:hypothetical protein